MRNWDAQDEEGGGACTADADLEDARMVGAHLGIPVETVRVAGLCNHKTCTEITAAVRILRANGGRKTVFAIWRTRNLLEPRYINRKARQVRWYKSPSGSAQQYGYDHAAKVSRSPCSKSRMLTGCLSLVVATEPSLLFIGWYFLEFAFEPTFVC